MHLHTYIHISGNLTLSQIFEPSANISISTPPRLFLTHRKLLVLDHTCMQVLNLDGFIPEFIFTDLSSYSWNEFTVYTHSSFPTTSIFFALNLSPSSLSRLSIHTSPILEYMYTYIYTLINFTDNIIQRYRTNFLLFIRYRSYLKNLKLFINVFHLRFAAPEMLLLP